MVKIVINACFGGFSLSIEALKLYGQRTGKKMLVDTDESSKYAIHCDAYNIPRHDPDLVAVVEELGDKAAGSRHAKLEVVEVETDRYIITEYDGGETLITPQSEEWIIVT